MILQVENCPFDEIDLILRDARQAFDEGKTRPLDFRITQLKKLYWLIAENEELIYDALAMDLGKPRQETFAFELNFLKNEILYIIDNLKAWMKDERLSVPWTFFASNFRLQKLPLGQVLIISPWNFPILLLISPLAGAIAAGCTVVCKSSEICPNASTLIARLADNYLDRSCYRIINGEIPTATYLLEKRFDKILYTGNETVGKIVASAAAKHLTPVILELGGKNPSLVTRHADLKLAAKRIMWGKTTNCGQICLSTDYVLIEKCILNDFIQYCREALISFYPQTAAEGDYGHIVNQHHFKRLEQLLRTTNGKVVIGGATCPEDRFIEPTVIVDVAIGDSLLSEEIFGPLLPVIAMDSVEEMISFINHNFPTPLAIYPYSKSKEEVERILSRVLTGGAAINDSFTHSFVENVPFGGVSSSGTGCYRGKASFDAFSHHRTVAQSPSWLESMLSMRYPPYTMSKWRRYKRLLSRRPWFDQTGKNIPAWKWWWFVIFGSILFKSLFKQERA